MKEADETYMISVIIPVYNRESTIERAAKSVLDQTYKNLELIIVDDCSTDKTADVIKSINDSRIKYVKHPSNQGACVARNTGIANAKGDYIAFQDSDDCWRPDKIELQLKCLNEFCADICFCAMERHGYPERIETVFPKFPRGIISYEQLLQRSSVSTQTLLAKRFVFDEFIFDPELKRMQDFDWVIRSGQKYKFVFDDQVMVDVYLQEDSISQYTISGCNKMIETSNILLHKYRSILDEYSCLEAYLLEQIALNKVRIGENAYKEYIKMFMIGKHPKHLVKAMLSMLHIASLINRIREGK